MGSRGLRVYTVYRSPRDYPDKIVVRGATVDHEGVKPDAEALYIGDSLTNARHTIMAHDPNLVGLPRWENDEPQIVEVWV